MRTSAFVPITRISYDFTRQNKGGREIETKIIAMMTTSSPQPIMRTPSGPIRQEPERREYNSNICESKVVDATMVNESPGTKPESNNILIRAACQGIRIPTTKSNGITLKERCQR